MDGQTDQLSLMLNEMERSGCPECADAAGSIRAATEFAEFTGGGSGNGRSGSKPMFVSKQTFAANWNMAFNQANTGLPN